MDTVRERLRYLRETRSRLSRRLQEVEHDILRAQSELEAMCEHDWHVDRAQYDHHTCYECAICGATR